MWNRIVRFAEATAGAVAGLYGGWSPALTILVIMMGVDYFTGVLAAATGHSDKTEGGGLSSKAGFTGIARKGVIMLIVLVATLLDRAAGGEGHMFQMAATGYYIANEGLSILENAARMQVPVPAGLKKALEGMRDEREQGRGSRE